LFRHLLIDVTGNTHRAEFCIDKLYSPTAHGAAGAWSSWRGFEMPPHSQMSLVQQLLLRGLVTDLEYAYEEKLIRWEPRCTTASCSPTFVGRISTTCSKTSVARAMHWSATGLRPIRFRSGDRQRRLRCGQSRAAYAIEPWKCWAKRRGPAGGSLRRLVGERGASQSQRNRHPRYIVTCNGRRVPLHPTGVRGEAVAAYAPRLGAAGMPASDDRRSRSFGVRHFRYLESPIDRWCHLARGTSGGAALRDLPCQLATKA